VHPWSQSDFAQQACITRVGTERFNPGLDAEPRHAVGPFLDTPAKPPVGRVAVAEADVYRAHLVRAEVLLAGNVLDTLNHLFRLVLETRDSQDDGLEREDCRALIESLGFLHIRYGFRVAAQVYVCDSLEGESKRRIGLELHAPSRQLDRVVVVLRKQQQARCDRVGSYRDRIEFDGSPYLPDRLVMSSLCGEVRRAVQARRCQGGIELERAQKRSLRRRTVPVVNEMNEAKERSRAIRRG